MTRPTEEILVEERDGVVCVTLNAPERRNPLTLTMASALLDALREAVGRGAGAAIVTGSGRGFCSGGDIGSMSAGLGGAADGDAVRAREGVLALYRKVVSVGELPVPVIAAINGSAVGAGLNLALACDIRLAARGAKLAASFLRIGLPPGMGAAWLLTHAVGPARAAEMIYSGEPVTAEEAERIGLVNRVVAPEALVDEAWSLARRIAAGPATATRVAKQALRLARTSDHETVLQFEAMAQAAAAGSDDLREGLRAFLEKRPPEFKAR